ncbi:MAG: pilus assembly protein [Propionibacteriaceae bacterium]|nr:pilus assembly protein [Propionibacteriaceae bacterium]
MDGTRPVNRHSEQGSVSVQIVLLLPTLLLMLWIALGTGMYFYGRTTALAAAQAAAAAGATEHGTDRDCVQTGTNLATRAGDSLAGITVTCRRTATTVTATVTGATLSLVPGWEPVTTQTATVPIERITR